jgi:hypothetical protein
VVVVMMAVIMVVIVMMFHDREIHAVGGGRQSKVLTPVARYTGSTGVDGRRYKIGDVACQ